MYIRIATIILAFPILIIWKTKDSISFIFKNVSSSTSHKKTPSFRLYVFPSLRPYVFPSLRPSLRDFKKILPDIFIYESILIKIYMNTNIMNTQIFHLKKYDFKGH